VKIDNRTASRLGLACLLLITACKAEEPIAGKDSKIAGCEGAVCPASAPPVDWSAAKPTYKAYVRVVDTVGAPVKDATVKVGDKSAVTDKDGRVAVGPLDAVQVATVAVEKEGATPQITKATAFSAAQTTQEVVVAAVDVDKMVDAQKQTTAEVKGAHVDVPARALATEDGTRATMARMQLTYFDGTEPSSLLPGDSEAVNDKGAPTALGPFGGVMYVRFDDEAKRPLNLAPGQTALLEMPLTASFRAADGQVIPLWSLDEVAGQWKKESSCLVSSRLVGGQQKQFCTGAVDHFSYWGFAREIDVYEPGSVGCVNATTVAEKDACFEVSLIAQNIWRCDAKGENCQQLFMAREYFYQRAPSVAWCGVVPVEDVTYRISTLYRTNTDKCPEVDGKKPEGGVRSKASEPLDLASFKEMLGSEVMLNFTLNPDRDCPTLCAQAALTITQKDIDAAPWQDADYDGVFASTDDNMLRWPMPVDCNDEDSWVHPGAPEHFCVKDDRNCDGRRSYLPYEKHTDVPAGTWNAHCRSCNAFAEQGWFEVAELPLTDEVTGNLYDENCDGVVQDMDGDGHVWPADCNDLDKNTHADAKEVPGNYVDENCNGVALDADGDGVFNPYHVGNDDAAGIDVDKFVDCDDYDPAVNPSAPVAKEVGALKDYYYQSGEDVRRAFYFCGLFTQDGKPSYLYYNAARDLNCDGFSTDLDGDGYAAPGDKSLGEGLDTDCNDHDPRVHPVSAEDPTCMAAPDTLNDTVCNVPSRATDGGCPILTVAGTDVVTRCEETKDQDGKPTGLGVCTFDGWWDGNPLVINPGSAWGPCDGDLETQPLPACPAGASCGGPLPYTEAFQSYIEKTYLMSMPVMFKGMCFPSCDITK
jgi:hypothetical protein